MIFRWLLALTFTISYAAHQAQALTRIQAIGLLQQSLKNETSIMTLGQVEKDLRSLFVSSLTLQIQKSFNEKDPHESIKRGLEKIRDIAKKDPSQFEKNYLAFLENINNAYKLYPERGENPILFVLNYLNFSSITSPESPDLFDSERSYHNGKTAISAEPTSLEEAGEIAALKIKSKEEPLPDWLKLGDNLNLKDEFQPFLN